MYEGRNYCQLVFIVIDLCIGEREAHSKESTGCSFRGVEFLSHTIIVRMKESDQILS